MPVIPLFPEPEQIERTLQGEAVCLACQHAWQAVVPAGVTAFECPACTAVKGVMREFTMKDEAHWQCGCGGWLFVIHARGTHCAVCGQPQSWD